MLAVNHPQEHQFVPSPRFAPTDPRVHPFHAPLPIQIHERQTFARDPAHFGMTAVGGDRHGQGTGRKSHSPRDIEGRCIQEYQLVRPPAQDHQRHFVRRECAERRPRAHQAATQGRAVQSIRHRDRAVFGVGDELKHAGGGPKGLRLECGRPPLKRQSTPRQGEEAPFPGAAVARRETGAIGRDSLTIDGCAHRAPRFSAVARRCAPDRSGGLVLSCGNSCRRCRGSRWRKRRRRQGSTQPIASRSRRATRRRPFS